ncbi:MAG: CoA-acylating methylmalonate-semialdehyde dehydrogenase [Brevefilum fermentans]|jgi:malonate-semialdehyde dehydrogenase (acetylating)/methylmalonate-semialdehyde dehydrogenase|uniref:methylmalonate-semialdehyde dehydrogenase (CoA acylating) n=1 Tax=Candidatus Brevifilum fermentans TaxID=1986204 RepID=A0A1Y6K3J6_9CHLR|nr:CoA-acylating methylmalonate-semialdehyde dehydrogenase [Brevefilum fermentans]SMX54204.1 Methylmalonate semialdehyde dehydrogenase [acylating] [Brevefilum fermentans]
MEEVLNYIDGKWIAPQAVDFVDVVNPGTGELLTRTPLCGKADVDRAAAAASNALPAWRSTPAQDRIQFLFKLKALLEANLDEIARVITMECGKTFDESRGEMRRAIENVEVACGIPMMMKGEIFEDIAQGVDEILLRQPVGVCATIAPFNFPGMIPFWYLPYALACGNTYIIKPSEKVPLTMQIIFRLIDQIGLPEGVVNLVNGSKTAVDAILDHPTIRAITFVGSTATARYIYRRAAENGKRVQAQGGAKNPAVILPDADMDAAIRIIADSAFGCAGQRCLASSLAITIGEAHNTFLEGICESALNRKVGYGLDEGVQMGPVINLDSRKRIEELIDLGIKQGADPLVDGRDTLIQGYENGTYIRPTILSDLQPHHEIARTEIFGPVLGLIHLSSLDEAIRLINNGAYGNQASLFTSSGAAARRFRYSVEAGNIGINIGVAAPMAFFPFSGWKDSFFGDLHGQGADAVHFFTQEKVVVERWPKEWVRKF